MKQQIVSFSIRWKLLTIMICMLVSVLAVSTYLQTTNQKQFYVDELALRIHLIKEKLISRGWTLSGHLSRQVENGLATINLSQISETLKKSVNEDSELYYAVLVDNSGRAYIHTLKPEMELELVTELNINSTNQQQPRVFEHSYYGIPVIEFIVPIEISAKPWGTLHLGFSLDTLNQETAEFEKDNEIKIQTMIEHSIYTVCFFLIISIVIILILSDRLSRPIRRLTRAVNKLAAGDFTVTDTLRINSKDEIGVLARAFDDMSKELRSSYFKLQNYNARLEQQVEERTVELAKARDEAVNANQSKSDFLSMISHEIRTPMNAIIGLTQLSLKTDLNPVQYEYLNNVKYSADSLMLIINDLLDISKIEAGKLKIEWVNFNIESVLTHLNTLVKIKIEEKQLKLHFSVKDDVPLYLNGDPLRLGQILLNLVNNAIKFTESGTIEVKIELLEDAVKDDSILMLRFSVIDSGIGLSKTQIDSLFKPYSQADVSTSRLYGGTGLGLFICRQLVELMGGTISVESLPNKGSHFIFTLRLNKVDDSTIHSGHLLTNTSEETPKNAYTGCKILVVDDYKINLEVAKALLEDKGFEVSLADNGEQAIQMVKQIQFDLILMDLKMPGLDGIETTDLIRKQSNCSDLPIIALTAQSTNEDKIRCLDRGMTDYISKPINIDQLLITLNKYISPEKIEQYRNQIDLINNADTESTSMLNLHLSAVNVEEGITRVSGQGRIFYQLLIDFELQFADVMLRIRGCLHAGNKLLAEQIVHGLKGVSGNIAAKQLSVSAAELESALVQQTNDLKIPLKHCEQALHQVLSEIKSIRACMQVPSENSDLQVDSDFKQALLELNKLTELLKLNDLDSDLGFNALKACFASSSFNLEMEKLGQCISVFDFKSALLITQQILQDLPVKQPIFPVLSTKKDFKHKILIVDDAPVNIKVLAEELRDQYNIQIATNGDDAALIAMADKQPDLILLDIEMPDMNGYELCLQLKENLFTKKIPVIFITGRTEVIDEKIGLEMGAVDYITKPFNPTVVQARVNSHMESKLRRDKLEQLATLDSLTGIPNRRMFNDFLEQEWTRARRSQKWLSLIFIDIDYFKQFNDFYGHTVGDQCLSIIAQTLKDSLKRNSDFLARYGGEEFIIILPETDANAAFLIAESMRLNVQNLNLPHIPLKGFYSVTLSLGVATMIPKEGAQSIDLVKAADDAVYKAKSNGRNRVQKNDV